MDTSLLLLWWAYISEIAWTIAGFGSSSIFLPLASQLLDFHHALILVAIYHIFGNMSRLSMFRRHRNNRIFLLFGIPSIIATVIGARLTTYIDTDLLKMLFWIVLFLFASYTLRKPTFQITPTPLIGRLGWALSWFSAWLIGTGWVLRGAFMTAFNLPKEQYIATIASVALVVDATRIPLYFAQGFLDVAYLRYIPLLFVIAFLWSRTGKQIVATINQQLFRTIILCAILCMSLLFVFQWISSLG